MAWRPPSTPALRGKAPRHKGPRGRAAVLVVSSPAPKENKSCVLEKSDQGAGLTLKQKVDPLLVATLFGVAVPGHDEFMKLRGKN